MALHLTGNNVHIINKKFVPIKVLLLSDIHWDNPKCDRDLLKKHLDQALAENIDILINGDLFCCMMGKYDPRSNKSDIRPEHNKNNYLDAVVTTAVEWFKPYAHLIKVVGIGNHEDSILQKHETNISERFVYGLNLLTGSDVKLGGYGGWIVYRFQRGKVFHAFRIKYMHGFGGGGISTKGVPQFNRMASMVEGANLIWMGHVHEDYEVTTSIETLNHFQKVELRDVLMVRTSTYKEEYNEGKGGWHVQKGLQPKVLGGRWLELHPERIVKDRKEKVKINAFTYKTL